MLKKNLDKISSKNYLKNNLIKPIHKFIKLNTKTNSKIQELKTYNKVINNFIYKNKWHKAIDKKL